MICGLGWKWGERRKWNESRTSRVHGHAAGDGRKQMCYCECLSQTLTWTDLDSARDVLACSPWFPAQLSSPAGNSLPLYLCFYPQPRAPSKWLKAYYNICKNYTCISKICFINSFSIFDRLILKLNQSPLIQACSFNITSVEHDEQYNWIELKYWSDFYSLSLSLSLFFFFF